MCYCRGPGNPASSSQVKQSMRATLLARVQQQNPQHQNQNFPNHIQQHQLQQQQQLMSPPPQPSNPTATGGALRRTNNNTSHDPFSAPFTPTSTMLNGGDAPDMSTESYEESEIPDYIYDQRMYIHYTQSTIIITSSVILIDAFILE